ncbi:MAG: AAA family ATPase [Opitutales bacterium]|nr:AAA family ATPase [Opitutales bacterium]
MLADRPDASAQFLILGSASPELSRKASESLTGRVETIEMGGFSLGEVGGERLDRLWIGVKRPYLDEYGCGLADQGQFCRQLTRAPGAEENLSE